jgi:hypothetical protein
MKFAIVGAGGFGDMRLKRPKATSEPKDIGPVDAAVVTVQPWQVAAAAPENALDSAPIAIRRS